VRWPPALLALHARLGAGPAGLGDPTAAAAAAAAADAFWESAEVEAVLGCGDLPAGLDAGLRGLAAGRRAKITAGRAAALREPPAGGWPAAAAVIAEAAVGARAGCDGAAWAAEAAAPLENPWRVSYRVEVLEVAPPAAAPARARLGGASALLRRGAAWYNASRLPAAAEAFRGALALVDEWRPRPTKATAAATTAASCAAAADDRERRPPFVPAGVAAEIGAADHPPPAATVAAGARATAERGGLEDVCSAATTLEATSSLHNAARDTGPGGGGGGGCSTSGRALAEVVARGRRAAVRALLNLAATLQRQGLAEEALAACSEVSSCNEMLVGHTRCFPACRFVVSAISFWCSKLSQMMHHSHRLHRL
jgi:hypothetical protein